MHGIKAEVLVMLKRGKAMRNWQAFGGNGAVGGKASMGPNQVFTEKMYRNLDESKDCFWTLERSMCYLELKADE